MLDGKLFGEEVVALVKGYVEREIGPLKNENAELKERLAALEARPLPEKGEPGEPGRSPEPEEVAAALLPISEEMIADGIAKAVAALPPPEKGDKGDPGDDGDHVTDAFVDEDGSLVLRLAGGTTLSAGKVVGKPGGDGEDGEDGNDAAGIVEALKDNGELVLTLQDGRLIRTGVRDGENGKPGRDGFSLEDFDCRVLDDDRTLEFAFKSGEHEHIATLKWPTVIDRGVFKAEKDYERGDAVTWAGSLWIAQKETSEKPGESESWRLAVKRGRDGKDAKTIRGEE